MGRKHTVLAGGVALLLVVLSFIYLQHGARQDASALVEDFLLAVEEGRGEEAAAYLELPPTETSTLLAAFTSPHIMPGSLEGINVSLLGSGQATVSMLIMGNTENLELVLQRTDGEWHISDFPEMTVLQDAYIQNVQETQSGHTYTFDISDEKKSFPATLPFDAEEGSVVDAVSIQGNLLYMEELPYVVLKEVLALKETTLEDINLGIIPIKPQIEVFSDANTEEGFCFYTYAELVPGMENIKAYMRDDTATALILQDKYIPNDIRVVINTTDFAGTGHQEITITSDSPFTLEDKLEKKSFPMEAKGQVMVVPGAEGITAILPGEERLHISTRLHFEGEGRLEVSTLTRGSSQEPFTPTYRGRLEVAQHDGALLLINQLPLEEYLYAVLPSEMPLHFGLEPLKAQAVAARSYAVTSIFNSSFKELGGHVDDSVLSQVYNNLPEKPLSTQAVQETTGLAAFFSNDIIDARFFSTSAGYTANFHEVWEDRQGNFPGEPIRYLSSNSQLVAMEFDLSNENRIRDFLDRTDLLAYDAHSPFFRWEVTMSRAELEATIAENLQSRFEHQPNFVLTRSGNNYTSQEISSEPLGQLKNIRVDTRGEGGNVMALEIIGETNSYRIEKEYNIRFLLKPVQYLPGEEDIILQRHDGSTLKNYGLLPSAFFYFHVNRNEDREITEVTIRGGGNGHGVGMSQYGAHGLSQQGHDFREILRHYYPKTELWSIYAW